MNDHKNLNDSHNYHKGNNDEIELIKKIVTGDVLQTIFCLGAISNHDWQPPWIWRVTVKVLSLFVTTDFWRRIALKHTFKGRYCKSMMNRSWMMENLNFGFLLFSVTSILKTTLGKLSIPQIVVNILIYHKSMCYS